MENNKIAKIGSSNYQLGKEYTSYIIAEEVQYFKKNFYPMDNSFILSAV